jgi:pentatricopeptide repeat protein
MNPDSVTYTSVIDGYGKQGELEKCEELVEEMKREGVRTTYATQRTQHNVIHATTRCA